MWAIAVFVPVLSGTFLTAQERQPQTVARPMSERAKKQQEARLRKELTGAYTRWVEQDVAYIISDEERQAFHRLQNDEEREQFIEQFWLRRDPTPDTVENEFKEEQYRRIAYANEHFASGIAGWRTDRGHIYITWGPPDERDEHPSGGTYERTPEEGGGVTSTFPFEIWRYRHLEGIDEDVNLEFVDKTMTGEYRLTTDPCEKDALARVPGAGPTQMELLGRSTRADRFSNTNGTTCGPSFGGQTEKMNPFRRLEVAAKVMSAPPIRFNDLRAVVESSVTYSTLPLQVQINYFSLTDASVLTYVTLQFENKDLQFQLKDGVQRAAVNILGRVSTMTRRPVMPFEATVSVDSPAQMLGEFIGKRSVYNTALPLAPGSYRLDVAAKDLASGSVTHYQAALAVPRLDPEKLQTSGILLTDVMEKVSSRSIGAGMFVIGDLKVRPRVDAHFRREERLGVYCKAYHFAGGSDSRGRSGQVEYEVVKAGTEERVYSAVEDLSQAGGAARSEVTIGRFVDLRDFAPGSYTIRLKVTDSNRGQTATQSATFTVL
jgi:GWxTD domain-containing protein